MPIDDSWWRSCREKILEGRRGRLFRHWVGRGGGLDQGVVGTWFVRFVLLLMLLLCVDDSTVGR